MSLTGGTRLGPYEILAPLGAGGMGEVYRARDPRMGHRVAIKLDADRFGDPRRRSRLRYSRNDKVPPLLIYHHAGIILADRQSARVLFRRRAR